MKNNNDKRNPITMIKGILYLYMYNLQTYKKKK